MKARLLELVLAVGVATATIAGPALAASASSQRSDEHVEIWCQTAEGPALWKTVDAHALDQGMETSISNFNANNPYGEFCQIGPF